MKVKTFIRLGLILLVLLCSVSCGIDLNPECTITYIGNGATSGKVESQVAKRNTYVKLNPNVFKIGDKQSEQWSTDPAGRFGWIPDGASYYVTGNVTLYAYWGDIQPLSIQFRDRAGQINIKNSSGTTAISYTLNGGELVNVNVTSTKPVSIAVPANGVISFYSTRNSTDFLNIKCTAECDVFGNIMSLVHGIEFDGETSIYANAFLGLFEGNTGIIDASSLVLPSATLAESCYESMFADCSKLTGAPELPAESLATNCYRYMFSNCSKLRTAPELPAMVLATGCYYYMFEKCTSLTKAPVLPAPTLVSQCYSTMFRDCSNLSYIKCLATDISASGCTDNWVEKTKKSGQFVKAPSMESWLTGEHGIPSGWTIVNAD